MALRPDPERERERDATFDALETFAAEAKRRGTEPSTLAIAWLLAQPDVTAVVVGPRRPEHLRSALAALEIEVSESDRDQLAAVFA
jgi:aryl-alcohol dehydrogenase-like predicted oxidoreductase